MPRKTNTMSSFSFVVPNSESSDVSIQPGIDADTRKLSGINRIILAFCPEFQPGWHFPMLLPLTISSFLF